MRRLAIIFLAVAAVVGLFSAVGSANAAGSTNASGVRGAAATADAPGVDLAPVDVVQVSGLIDEILVDEIQTAIRRSESDGAQALILQMNSGGAVVSRDRMEDLMQSVAESKVPIGIWVGPSGASLTGLGAQLLAVADATGMAPGTSIGKYGTPLTVPRVTVDFGRATEQMRKDSIGFQDARTLGALKLPITDEGVPAIKNMVLAMDGVQARGRTLDTVTETLDDNGNTQINATLVRFFKLPLINQLLHTVSSPAVAYLLFIVGLALLIFEFFTAGVGVAGVVGAGSLILACYGLAALPVRGWAVGALLLAMFAFAVDVQVGVPRLWTGVGVVLAFIGSFFLFRDVLGADLGPSWITLLAGVGGIVIAFVVGMPSMVRTRFATPTVGREWMIGETGTAIADISPEGIAEVSGGRWRARTNRATPIKAGDVVRVTAIDGVTLEVEPEVGGAQDYREMRKQRKASATN
ncbi:MAG TPA: NfeD family protein [Ilumatobacteraceae bacterium]|nr:NfeD family protein [Ilumatobacteraceae bacterium]